MAPMPQHARKWPRPRVWLQRLGAALLGVVLFIGVGAWAFTNELNSHIKSSNINHLLDQPRPADAYEGRALNILLIGSDTRIGQGNDQFGEADGMRSDTTLVVHISADRKSIQAVSIPRDILVEIPRCERSDGSEYAGTDLGMFNSAFAHGGAHGDLASAVACTWKTVEKMSGLRLDDYIVVDFNGFQHMVEALGGVKMWMDQDYEDPEALLDLKKGCAHLDGQQALAWARARKFLGDGSDQGRIARQQRLMGVLYRTAMSKNFFTDFASLSQFATASLDTLTTSPELASVSVMGGLAYSLRNTSAADVHFVILPNAEYPYDTNRSIPTEAADAVWEALRRDQPLPSGLPVRDAAGHSFVIGDNAPSAAPSTGAQAGAATPDTTASQGTASGQDNGQDTEGQAPSGEPSAPTVTVYETIDPPGSAINEEEAALIAQCEP